MEFEISFIISLFTALVCGAAIGLERQFHGSPAGLRTHMLVCIGGCLTCIASLYVQTILGLEGDIFRISAQVVSGIGFLGAGIIIFKHFSIMGLTTAAGIWTTAIIGLLAGFGFYFGAFIACAFVLAINTVILFIERQFPSITSFYVEIDDLRFPNELIDTLKASNPRYYHFKIESPRSCCPGHIGVVIKIKNIKDKDEETILAHEHIVVAYRD